MAHRRAGVTYGRQPAGPRIGPITEDDMAQMDLPAPPDGLLSLAGVGRGANLRPLAAHFHDHLARQWKLNTVQIEVRALVRWIARHVDLSPPRRVQDRDGRDALEDVPGGEAPDRWTGVGPEVIGTWAACLANQLNPKAARALYLHHGMGVDLKGAAKAMGYRRPSGVSYALKGAVDELTCFTRDLPGLGKEDFDRDIWDIFWNALMTILKNRFPDPLN
jgi:hypothetical protein